MRISDWSSDVCSSDLGVVELEVLLDACRSVAEVDDHRRGLAREDSVQPRERLHRGDAGKLLVDVHGQEARFVEAGVELVGDDEDLEIGREACRERVGQYM